MDMIGQKLAGSFGASGLGRPMASRLRLLNMIAFLNNREVFVRYATERPKKDRLPLIMIMERATFGDCSAITAIGGSLSPKTQPRFWRGPQNMSRPIPRRLRLLRLPDYCGLGAGAESDRHRWQSLAAAARHVSKSPDPSRGRVKSAATVGFEPTELGGAFYSRLPRLCSLQSTSLPRRSTRTLAYSTGTG